MTQSPPRSPPPWTSSAAGSRSSGTHLTPRRSHESARPASRSPHSRYGADPPSPGSSVSARGQSASRAPPSTAAAYPPIVADLEPADLVVVGAGTIGGWASWFAKRSGIGRVIVLDRGLAGQGASSRAAGIVRAQGGTPTTVALGRWSIDFYRRQVAEIGTDSGFRELGYLILAVTDEDERLGRDRVAMQQGEGLAVRWLSAEEAAAEIPTLSPHGHRGGSHPS